MPTYNYSIEEIAGNYGGIPFTGLIKGESITAEIDGEDWAGKQGTGGLVLRVEMINNLGSASVKLEYGSPSNELLSIRRALDKKTKIAAGSFSIKDLHGTTLVQCDVAWIKKAPSHGQGEEPTEMEWLFGLANPKFHAGVSNLVIITG